MKRVLIFIVLLLTLPISVSAKVKIEETIYDSLEEAIAGSKEGDTIILLDDIDVSDTTKYEEYHNWLFPDNVTLDLNKHTITTGNNGNCPNAVWLGNNLTIKNGYFNSKQKKSGSDEYTETNYALFLGDMVETSNITVEDVTVSTGINIFNTLNLTLKNVTATGRDYYAVWLDEHATVTIESGNFSTNGVAVVGVTKTDEFNSELIIKGGTFISNEDNFSLSQKNSSYLKPLVMGGTYNFDVKDFVLEDYECVEDNGKFNVDVKKYDRDFVLSANDNLSVKMDDEKLSEILVDSINKIDGVNVDKKDVNIVLKVEEANLNKEEENKFISKLSDGKLISYYDIAIDIIEKDTNNKIGNVTELSKKITLSIDIPSDLKVKEGFNRKYYILREHDGNIDIIEPVVSNNTLVFETDRFSTYAVMYRDTEIINEEVNNPSEDIENPRTYDKLTTYTIITIISFVGLLTGALYIKHKEF